ncbi:MAG: gephyrin-like molybdotransferase Glp [Pseudomonadota bacterium]
MAQLSDDCFAHGGELLQTREALALISERIGRLTGDEELPLDQALGRILVEDVVGQRPIPPLDNSAVDGFAVYFDDLKSDGETELPIAGRATAGHPLPQDPAGAPVARGSAVRIFTGAVMPAGPDTVMMQEDCRIEADKVIIQPGIKRGANRRLAGEDVSSGATVLRAGQRLRPQDLGQAAAVGREKLLVSKAVRVALFSTGDELACAGEVPKEGQIFDSNRHTLTGLLQGLGCQVSDLGILRDRAEVITRALAEAAPSHDLILTSGGVSVGDEDHVKAAVEQLGSLYAWRLAIKPGRPVALGQVGGTAFAGLPGNPVAVVVTFLTIVRPALLRMMGASHLTPRYYKLRAAFDHRKKQNRREWVRVHLEEAPDGETEAHKFPRDGAGILSSLVEADGLVELPEGLTQLSAGAMVDFLPFNEVIA